MAGAKRAAKALGGKSPLGSRVAKVVAKPDTPAPGGALAPTPRDAIIAQMLGPTGTHRGVPLPPENEMIVAPNWTRGSGPPPPRLGTTAGVQNGGIPPYPQGNRIPGPPPPPPGPPARPRGLPAPPAGNLPPPDRAAATAAANQKWLDQQAALHRQSSDMVPDFASAGDMSLEDFEAAHRKPGFIRRHPYGSAIIGGGIGLGAANAGLGYMYDRIRANPQAEYEGGQPPPSAPVPTQDEMAAKHQEILNQIRGQQ